MCGKLINHEVPLQVRGHPIKGTGTSLRTSLQKAKQKMLQNKIPEIIMTMN
jgi:hypothetical protein